MAEAMGHNEGASFFLSLFPPLVFSVHYLASSFFFFFFLGAFLLVFLLFSFSLIWFV